MLRNLPVLFGVLSAAFVSAAGADVIAPDAFEPDTPIELATPMLSGVPQIHSLDSVSDNDLLTANLEGFSGTALLHFKTQNPADFIGVGAYTAPTISDGYRLFRTPDTNEFTRVIPMYNGPIWFVVYPGSGTAVASYEIDITLPASATCPSESLFGNPPDNPQGPVGGADVSDTVYAQAIDQPFSGVTGAIGAVNWYGLLLDANNPYADCSHTAHQFAITFFSDNAGAPGEVVAQFDVTPQVYDTLWPKLGQTSNTDYYFYVDLPAPVTLSSGWIRIQGENDAACGFNWTTSTGLGYAFCLLPPPIDADATLETCYDDAVFSQPPLPVDPKSTTYGLDSDAIFNNTISYEKFSGLSDGFQTVRWWGCDRSVVGWPDYVSQCAFEFGSFEITVHPDVFSQPGAAAYTFEVTPRLLRVGGLDVNYYLPLYRYEAELPQLVTLSDGWISIHGLNNTDCGFYWATSAAGDGASLQRVNGTNTPQTTDLALCMGPTRPSTVDCSSNSLASQLPYATDDPDENYTPSDTLVSQSVYDDFHGLSAPITVVTWFGSESISGGACARTFFQITFYTDVLNQPGQQQASFDIIADRTTSRRIPISVFADEYIYYATLPTPVALSDGWIGIQATGVENCAFYWLAAPGNGNSVALSNGNLTPSTADLAWCLGGVTEGEGQGEGGVEGAIAGEGQGNPSVNDVDQDGNYVINLSELLRAIQLYNSLSFHCDALTEDGFAPGPGDQTCTVYDGDYADHNWSISLSELLRLIQLFNSLGYHYCPTEGTEDGFCPGLV